MATTERSNKPFPQTTFRVRLLFRLVFSSFFSVKSSAFHRAAWTNKLVPFFIICFHTAKPRKWAAPLRTVLFVGNFRSDTLITGKSRHFLWRIGARLAARKTNFRVFSLLLLWFRVIWRDCSGQFFATRKGVLSQPSSIDHFYCWCFCFSVLRNCFFLSIYLYIIQDGWTGSRFKRRDD